MNEPYLFSTCSNDLDKSSAPYCGDNSIILDDSTSGDEYLSKDEFQGSGSSKSTFTYTQVFEFKWWNSKIEVKYLSNSI